MIPKPHLPYTPNLTSNDFFVIVVSWMKNVLKGNCFANVEKVKQKMAEVLKSIKIDEFKNCFEQWKKHVGICIS